MSLPTLNKSDALEKAFMAIARVMPVFVQDRDTVVKMNSVLDMILEKHGDAKLEAEKVIEFALKSFRLQSADDLKRELNEALRELGEL